MEGLISARVRPIGRVRRDLTWRVRVGSGEELRESDVKATVICNNIFLTIDATLLRFLRRQCRMGLYLPH